MKNSKEIVYYNNQTLGYIDDSKCKTYNLNEKEELLKSIQNEIIKKESNRKLSSLIIGLTMLLVAVVIAILMLLEVITLGNGQWFNYTFLLTGLILLWVSFYYVVGFIFYSKININIHFKNPKLSDHNVCLTYASSNYFKWVNKYMNSLTTINFFIKNGKKKKNIPVGFGLRMPSNFKNMIFNGHINCNVPYYYLTIKSAKLIFLPGIVLFIDGLSSSVFLSNQLRVTNENKTYHLYNNDKLLVSFDYEGEFNINFFYFKYEQL